MTRTAKKSAGSVGRSGDPFLPGSEERVASADLQASLKSMAANAGVNLLAIRGLQGGRSQPLHMIAVSVELEGPLKADQGHDFHDRESDAAVVCLHGLVPEPGGRGGRSDQGRAQGSGRYPRRFAARRKRGRPWVAGKPVPASATAERMP